MYDLEPGAWAKTLLWLQLTVLPSGGIGPTTVLEVLFWLSILVSFILVGYLFLSVLSWTGCPATAILSCLGLVVQLQLYCPVSPIPDFFVLWWGYPSCQFNPESAVLFWQSVLASLILTIHYASSHALLVHSACPLLGCPVLAIMSFGHASE